MEQANDFDALIADAEAAAVDGWGFSWLHGRAVEQRPTWGYAHLLGEHAEHSRAMLDVQTGGAEVLSDVLDRASKRPSTIAATESWLPNLTIAGANLARREGSVVQVLNDQGLPFKSGAFDLVTSRHPVSTRWDEISRVLARGGRYLAQHVGSGSNRELTDFFMGPQPVSGARSPAKAAADATAQGLEVLDLREESLRVEFYDVGAVVYFLRKVLWTVPDFTVDRYRARLARMHEAIRSDGSFVSTAERFLVELRKA